MATRAPCCESIPARRAHQRPVLLSFAGNVGRRIPQGLNSEPRKLFRVCSGADGPRSQGRLSGPSGTVRLHPPRPDKLRCSRRPYSWRRTTGFATSTPSRRLTLSSGMHGHSRSPEWFRPSLESTHEFTIVVRIACGEVELAEIECSSDLARCAWNDHDANGPRLS